MSYLSISSAFVLLIPHNDDPHKIKDKLQFVEQADVLQLVQIDFLDVLDVLVLFLFIGILYDLLLFDEYFAMDLLWGGINLRMNRMNVMHAFSTTDSYRWSMLVLIWVGRWLTLTTTHRHTQNSILCFSAKRCVFLYARRTSLG